MNAQLWRADTYRLYRPKWNEHPALAGNKAPYVCQIADCNSPGYVVVRIPEHMTTVCLTHADSLYADYGYVVAGLI